MADVSFYRKDRERQSIRPELFSTVAEELARELGAADRKLNKRSQIRKFYDEVMRLNSMAKANPEDWPDILPYVNMLIAKATYAEGRELVTSGFVSFIKNSTNEIHVSKDLEVFANLFEAFMGFYKKYRPRD